MFITFEQLKKSLETLRDFVFRITPQYTSDLVNDSGFAIKDDIPRSTSDLVNNSGFITVDDIDIPEPATPDWNATNTQDGYIENKPDIKAGTGTDSVTNSHSVASGAKAFAIGNNNTASGENSFVTGSGNSALGVDSFASGNFNMASGQESHAEGGRTTSSGSQSHAEGYMTTASGARSHAEGYRTVANHKSQSVSGEFNAVDTNTSAPTARGDYVEIVGNGTSASARSNARTLDWNGNEWLSGTLKVGGTSYNDANAKEVATKDYVDSKTPDWNALENTPGFIANKPPIETGSGTKSLQKLDSNDVASGTGSIAFGSSTSITGITLSGEANATTYTWTYTHPEFFFYTLPLFGLNAGMIQLSVSGQSVSQDDLVNIVSVDPDNHTLTTESTLSEIALVNHQAVIYFRNVASGNASKSLGRANVASGSGSLATGYETVATGINSVAHGIRTSSTGDYSMALGAFTRATGRQSFAQGGYSNVLNCVLTGDANATVYNYSSTVADRILEEAITHSNAFFTSPRYVSIVSIDTDAKTITTKYTLSEQALTETTCTIMIPVLASGQSAFATGNSTMAIGDMSRSEGSYTAALGDYSHADGVLTLASHAYQHVFGVGNIEDPSSNDSTEHGTYVEIVGNGLTSKRSNARTLDWSGNEWIQGTLKVGGSSYSDANAKEVATKEYIDNAIAALETSLKQYIDTSISSSINTEDTALKQYVDDAIARYVQTTANMSVTGTTLNILGEE